MVKIYSILSLLALSSFTLVAGKPTTGEVNYYYGDYKSGDCKELNNFLKKQKVDLTVCAMTESNEDVTYVEISGDSINQKAVNKIGSFSSTIESVTFSKITSLPKNLNLESLKVDHLTFDNDELIRNGREQDIYIPKNVLKTAKNVNKLSIYGFNISQKNINDIASLTKLNSLFFEKCDFDDNMIYTNLKDLKNLNTLILDTIFIKGEEEKMLNQLPESVCQMKKLKTLISYRNDITTLPECIKNLKNLEELDFNLNALVSIPKEIDNLTKLKVVKMNENQLESIPAEFGKLTKLEELYLEGNKIATLPDEFGNLSSLKKLELSYNLIGSIPTAIGKLSNLEHLFLNNNKVYRIPSSITKLRNLKLLDLSDNKIMVIPDAIKKLKNLESLNLNDNLISEIPEAIAELNNLEYFDLVGNDVNANDVPESVQNLPNLKILFEYE